MSFYIIKFAGAHRHHGVSFAFLAYRDFFDLVLFKATVTKDAAFPRHGELKEFSDAHTVVLIRILKHQFGFCLDKLCSSVSVFFELNLMLERPVQTLNERDVSEELEVAETYKVEVLAGVVLLDTYCLFLNFLNLGHRYY